MTRYTIKDIEGMVKRLNNRITELFAASDIRYSVEQTETNQYSINVVDISFNSIPNKTERIKPIGQQQGIIRSLCMNSAANTYYTLYAMCNLLDGLTYTDSRYEVLKY